MPRIIRSMAFLAAAFALLGIGEARADRSRGVFRAGGGRVLMRQSQHVCSANNLAFWQGAFATGTDLTKFVLPIVTAKNSGTKSGSSGKATGDGTFKESSEALQDDTTITQAQADLVRAAGKYDEIVKAYQAKIEAVSEEGDFSSNATKQGDVARMKAELKQLKILQSSGAKAGAGAGADDDGPNPGGN